MTFNRKNPPTVRVFTKRTDARHDKHERPDDDVFRAVVGQALYGYRFDNVELDDQAERELARAKKVVAWHNHLQERTMG